jgi:hypothetical protein
MKAVHFPPMVLMVRGHMNDLPFRQSLPATLFEIHDLREAGMFLDVGSVETTTTPLRSSSAVSGLSASLAAGMTNSAVSRSPRRGTCPSK